jgi:hypothetical protein
VGLSAVGRNVHACFTTLCKFQIPTKQHFLESIQAPTGGKFRWTSKVFNRDKITLAGVIQSEKAFLSVSGSNFARLSAILYR